MNYVRLPKIRFNAVVLVTAAGRVIDDRWSPSRTFGESRGSIVMAVSDDIATKLSKFVMSFRDICFDESWRVYLREYHNSRRK